MNHCNLPQLSFADWLSTLKMQGSVPGSLKEVLAAADPVKKRQVLHSLSQHLIPIMEKGLVDKLLSHRYAPSCVVPPCDLGHFLFFFAASLYAIAQRQPLALHEASFLLA